MNLIKQTTTLDGILDLPESHTWTDDPAAAEVMLVGGKAIDLDALPNLKGIFKCGVGTDNLPFAEAEKRGIKITLPSEKTRDVIFEETANFAVQLVFRALFHDSALGDFASWSKTARPALKDQKVLVLGTGKIGARVVEKLTPFVTVLPFDVSTHSLDSLPAMLEEADVVTLHLPLSEETRGWFNSEKMASMKEGAWLVNTARAPIVPEQDLAAALESGRIRAAFDVFWQEPYSGDLMKYVPDRLIVTPHVASTCQAFLEGLATDFNDFVHELMQGDET